jgi:hypothetical protein
VQEAINEWRELNTAAHFVTLCQQVQEFAGSLPLLLLHKHDVLAAITQCMVPEVCACGCASTPPSRLSLGLTLVERRTTPLSQPPVVRLEATSGRAGD